MKSRDAIYGIISELKKAYPDALCALKYEKDYELLFAARLSAQCTDERVNIITKTLFKQYPTLSAFAEAAQEELEQAVHSCGFFRVKSRDIIACAQLLLSKYGGKLPDTLDELITLPGVGRKTANLIMGDIYGKPAIVADTHCIRLSNKLGLAHSIDPYKVELSLKEQIPPEEQSDFCHRLVLHGRAVCIARRPKCGECSISMFCDEFIGNRDE